MGMRAGDPLTGGYAGQTITFRKDRGGLPSHFAPAVHQLGETDIDLVVSPLPYCHLGELAKTEWLDDDVRKGTARESRDGATVKVRRAEARYSSDDDVLERMMRGDFVWGNDVLRSVNTEPVNRAEV